MDGYVIRCIHVCMYIHIVHLCTMYIIYNYVIYIYIYILSYIYIYTHTFFPAYELNSCWEMLHQTREGTRSG